MSPVRACAAGGQPAQSSRRRIHSHFRRADPALANALKKLEQVPVLPVPQHKGGGAAASAVAQGSGGAVAGAVAQGSGASASEAGGAAGSAGGAAVGSVSVGQVLCC